MYIHAKPFYFKKRADAKVLKMFLNKNNNRKCRNCLEYLHLQIDVVCFEREFLIFCRKTGLFNKFLSGDYIVGIFVMLNRKEIN